MTHKQQQAHDWLMSQPDLITDCLAGALITERACNARRLKWRNHETTESDEDGLVLVPRFKGCEECHRFKAIRIPKRLQTRGILGKLFNPRQVVEEARRQ